ncbi:MAG: sugar-binding protein, partial [Bacteroidales bacterium]|nr:sugar-binding protein [Bacteroidales bacterium]
MKHIRILSLFAVLLALTACGGTDPDVPEETIEVTDYVFSKPSFVFGFSGQKRYSYCPSVIANADGTSHVYFCGNPNQGTMVDNIYHIVENANGTHTTAVSVLQPSLSWDSHHTCDPSVIEGSFKMDGTTYKYALFFLSNPKEYYYNEIGVAFSNDLEAASWVKYPQQIVKKTWPDEGDQSLGGNSKSWGVGQPSAVSLDKGGRVLLVYTIGDASGTRLA